MDKLVCLRRHLMLTCHEITSQMHLLRQTWLLYLVRRG